jgi:hypothetical protein
MRRASPTSPPWNIIKLQRYSSKRTKLGDGRVSDLYHITGSIRLANQARMDDIAVAAMRMRRARLRGDLANESRQVSVHGNGRHHRRLYDPLTATSIPASWCRPIGARDPAAASTIHPRDRARRAGDEWLIKTDKGDRLRGRGQRRRLRGRDHGDGRQHARIISIAPVW